jgi:carbon storage regulator
MLVLSRKLNESLIIDGRITVTVVDVRGGRVRLAIDAPAEVPVHRREVHERIERSHPAALAEGMPDRLCCASS